MTSMSVNQVCARRPAGQPHPYSRGQQVPAQLSWASPLPPRQAFLPRCSWVTSHFKDSNQRPRGIVPWCMSPHQRGTRPFLFLLCFLQICLMELCMVPWLPASFPRDDQSPHLQMRLSLGSFTFRSPRTRNRIYPFG